MNDKGIIAGPGRIEFRRVFPLTPEKLWSYLVEDRLRRKWLCGGAVEPRVGGTAVFDFDHRRLSATAPPDQHAEQNAVHFEGTVLVWDPPKQLAFTWPEADGKTSTRVTIGLKAVATGTQLHLVHENLHEDEDRLGAAAGWHTHLDLLSAVVSGERAPDFWLRHAELEDAYRQAV